MMLKYKLECKSSIICDECWNNVEWNGKCFCYSHAVRRFEKIYSLFKRLLNGMETLDNLILGVVAILLLLTTLLIITIQTYNVFLYDMNIIFSLLKSRAYIVLNQNTIDNHKNVARYFHKFYFDVHKF